MHYACYECHFSGQTQKDFNPFVTSEALLSFIAPASFDLRYRPQHTSAMDESRQIARNENLITADKLPTEMNPADPTAVTIHNHLLRLETNLRRHKINCSDFRFRAMPSSTNGMWHPAHILVLLYHCPHSLLQLSKIFRLHREPRSGAHRCPCHHSRSAFSISRPKSASILTAFSQVYLPIQSFEPVRNTWTSFIGITMLPKRGSRCDLYVDKSIENGIQSFSALSPSSSKPAKADLSEHSHAATTSILPT